MQFKSWLYNEELNYDGAVSIIANTLVLDKENIDLSQELEKIDKERFISELEKNGEFLSLNDEIQVAVKNLINNKQGTLRDIVQKMAGNF